MTMGVPAAILASIVSLTVAVAVVLRRPARPIYTRLALFALALFFWHGVAVASRFAGETTFRLQVAAASLIAPPALAFFAEIIRDYSLFTRRVIQAAIVATALLLVLVFTPVGAHIGLAALATLYVVTAFAWTFHTLYLRRRTARTEAERKRLSYLLGGGLLTLLLALGELVPGVELLAAIGHVAATFYVYFLYQSVLARRVIDLVDLLGKAAVLGVLTLVLAFVYALLLLWVGTEQPGLWLFNTLVASFVVLILYDQVRPWVEETTARLLFRPRVALRQAVRKLLRDLRAIISLDEMVGCVVDGLHESGRADHVAVYLASEGELEFELKGSRGTRPPQGLSLRQHPALLQELRRDRRPILLDALIDRYQDRPTTLTDGDPTAQRDLERTGEEIATMRALNAHVVLPMTTDDRIAGILALGSDRAIDAYTSEEIGSLLSIADACAVVIENSQEYERLRARDRLVAVGEMAAGMAHEVRNPLGAIKGAAQCLEPESLPREMRELVAVIIEETDRLARVLGEFLEYARPYRGNPSPTDVNAVITATLRLIENEPHPRPVALSTRLADTLAPALVDPEHLKQVVINLIHNACEAAPGAVEVTITTAASRSSTGEYWLGGRNPLRDHVIVRVHDNGPGIPAEDLQRVFLPFFTTKPTGTGLGLAISDRIIRNSGGRLEVSSNPGQGTTFTIRLPIAEATDATSR